MIRRPPFPQADGLAPPGFVPGAAGAAPWPPSVDGVTGRVWALYGAGVLAALTLPAVKLPVAIELRVGQLALAGVFALILLRDLLRQEVQWGPLLAITGGGVLLSGLSLLSLSPQVKEITFVIKYLVIFPTAFYVGARLAVLAGAARLTRVVELTLLAGCLLAVALHFHPVPLLVHERPDHLSVGLKGSFWEQGELAFFAGLFLVASLGLRLEHRLPARRTWLLFLLYAFAVGCALASLNKTVWVALLGSFLATAFLYRGDSRLGGVARSWTSYLALGALLGALALAAYNAWLPPGEKLVTAQMLEHKWENERGAALRLAWDLVAGSPWLGRGFGFVEAYFGSYPTDVIGLGSGVAQLFNSYLDIWLSAGIPGLMYALGLLTACTSRRSLLSVLIVSYLFVFANVNPVAQHEYYYLFLGVAFAAARSRIGALPGDKENDHERQALR